MFPTASDDLSILSVDIGILIGLLVMARLLDPLRTRDRILFGVTTAAFLILYALWRWRDTLPDFALSAQSLWSWLFISFELLAILYTLLSVIILFRSTDRTTEADAAQRGLSARDGHPAVDVFICTYNEEERKLPWVVEGILSKVAGAARAHRLDSQSFWLYEFSEAS